MSGNWALEGFVRSTDSLRRIAVSSSWRRCASFEVAPSGYYGWLRQPISNRAQADARLLRLIKASFIASHGIYGAPRVFLDHREAGETCSKHRVEHLMRENGLSSARLPNATRFWRQAVSQIEPSRAEHEPERELPGQRRGGVLLRQSEERTEQETQLQEPRDCGRGHFRLHRVLLQSYSSSQPSKRHES